MKKILVILLIVLLMSTTSFATEVVDDTHIPEMTLEELIKTMQSRQAKVDIIKKNNIEITNLKESLKLQIKDAVAKVNLLNSEVSNEDTVITDEMLEKLRSLLTFLQQSKKALEEDVEKISTEIESILDLISTKGMQLDQYDLLIEKQNEVIVEMKAILEEVKRI